MAHKHNRRRVRPRVRQNRYNVHSDNVSYDTLSLPQQIVAHPSYIRSLTHERQNRLPQFINGINRWQAQHTPTKFERPFPRPSPPDLVSPKSAIDVESDRIKMFGGEPGESGAEDIGLCFKMVEAFESMDWVHG